MAGVSAIVVSYNRRETLLANLARLREIPEIDEVIVVDNASTDGSEQAASRAIAASDRVIALRANTGVDAYNVGAAAATGEFILLLDDDSWPDAGAMTSAVAAMRADEAIGAIALSPRHPRTGDLEWPHAVRATDALPMMGCGNLIRSRAWHHAGGYERTYFLYRNDADLALTLLGLGWKVRFDPRWIVWHDSPAASVKSERWLRLATRNWVWMARRHGEGIWKWLGGAMGIARAYVHAGCDAGRVDAVTHGLREGLSTPPPAAPTRAGTAWRDLVKLQVSRSGSSGVDRSQDGRVQRGELSQP